MKPAEKSAAAYLRAGKIYLHPDSRTVKGFWIACEPILVTNENDRGLGEQVLQILAKSTENIPDPESLASSDSWNSVKALVRAAGVRSYEAFANSAQCVGICSTIRASFSCRRAKKVPLFEAEITMPAGRKRDGGNFDGGI